MLQGIRALAVQKKIVLKCLCKVFQFLREQGKVSEAGFLKMG